MRPRFLIFERTAESETGTSSVSGRNALATVIPPMRRFGENLAFTGADSESVSTVSSTSYNSNRIRFGILARTVSRMMRRNAESTCVIARVVSFVGVTDVVIVSKRMTARTSSVSPRVASRSSCSVPISGNPTNVLSNTSTGVIVVSNTVSVCDGHSFGQPAPPSSDSAQAPAPAASITARTGRRRRFMYDAGTEA